MRLLKAIGAALAVSAVVILIIGLTVWLGPVVLLAVGIGIVFSLLVFAFYGIQGQS